MRTEDFECVICGDIETIEGYGGHTCKVCGQEYGYNEDTLIILSDDQIQLLYEDYCNKNKIEDMEKFLLITIAVDGIIETHIAFPFHGYKTVCGLDGDDRVTDQEVIKDTLPKVDCEHCINIWKFMGKVPPKMIGEKE